VRALFVALLATVAGCYSPDPPSGTYLCGADGACPSGLLCECGQCVDQVGAAACSFEIAASNSARKLDVEEHERFKIDVRALKQDGSPANGFAGSVTLSSTWGDVCVGTAGCLGAPDKVTLAGGVASGVEVQLNRETISPQTAILRAEFAAAVGTSGKLQINVAAPTFMRGSAPLVPPLETDYERTGLKLTVLPRVKFGSAAVFAGAPSVIKQADGWRMYFSGGGLISDAGPTGDKITAGTSVASSTDGKRFMPPTAPLFEIALDSESAVGSASALATSSGVSVFFGRAPAFPRGATATPIGFTMLARLRAAAPEGPFAVADAVPGITTGVGPMGCTTGCALDAPHVLFDPNAALYGGGSAAQLMFFSSVQREKNANGDEVLSIAIVRATSLDGESFEVDPSPVLKSTADEFVIYSPRVVVDGSVYKMFYSTVAFNVMQPLADLTDPCSASYHVGYATSTDGLFWVRSPRNAETALVLAIDPAAKGPVFDIDDTVGAWEQGGSILVGSVVPVDGADPSSGLALYYSPYARVGPAGFQRCYPNGIGRADRR